MRPARDGPVLSEVAEDARVPASGALSVTPLGERRAANVFERRIVDVRDPAEIPEAPTDIHVLVPVEEALVETTDRSKAVRLTRRHEPGGWSTSWVVRSRGRTRGRTLRRDSTATCAPAPSSAPPGSPRWGSAARRDQPDRVPCPDRRSAPQPQRGHHCARALHQARNRALADDDVAVEDEHVLAGACRRALVTRAPISLVALVLDDPDWPVLRPQVSAVPSDEALSTTQTATSNHRSPPQRGAHAAQCQVAGIARNYDRVNVGHRP